MEARKVLFEKIEDVLTVEHQAAQIYEECLALAEDERVISLLSKLREDETRHVPRAGRLLEIAQG